MKPPADCGRGLRVTGRQAALHHHSSDHLKQATSQASSNLHHERRLVSTDALSPFGGGVVRYPLLSGSHIEIEPTPRSQVRSTAVSPLPCLL
ncbi:hypothetical protein IG631_15503 [Alternaria alternata]|nr:hypothetical protein IG631_15503 [Alternaria alternata]